MGSGLLLPREHGAYGQIAFPLLTAFAVAGMSPGGLLFAAAVLASFITHEPGMVLLGRRGIRARAEHGGAAMRWFGVCASIAVIAAIAAIATMPPDARRSIAIPLAPAALLCVAIARNREKSWYGELAAALAFSGAAIPVCLAASAPASTAVAVAVSFALLFITGTLAVRVVVLRVRGGGDPRAAALTRWTTGAVVAGSALALGMASAAQGVPHALPAAAAPGLLAAGVVAAFPPPARRLRTVGWMLVSASAATSLILVAML
jgi:hypothetical protein